jgi:hypothetical protein
MAQNRTDNFNIAAPKPIDSRYLNGNVPYASTTEAHSLISYKHIGLTVLVDKGGVPTEYHYKNSISSASDLVEKTPMTISYTIAQLRALSSTTGQAYTSTDGGTWIDLGLGDGQYVDDGGLYILSSSGHILKRQFSGDINVLWFGADPTGSTNSIDAFNAATILALSTRQNLYIPKGTYKLNNSWIIPGRSNASSILVKGDGARNTILDFTDSTDTICVQYGTPNSNTLHGGMSDFQISGPTRNVSVNGTSVIEGFSDGLVISSNAPYSNAFNTFSNIYMFRVKDGVTFAGLSSNTSSNFQNFFYNIMVEQFWGRGIFCDGAMNVFDGGFIVGPYGPTGYNTPGMGENSLAVYDYGGGNTYNNIPSEDQWVFNGSNTKVTRCTTELIQKTVAGTAAGRVVIRIGGGGVSIDGFTITTVTNVVVDQMMGIYSQGVTLKNISYLNPGDDPRYVITYPILPSSTSSGTMENVSCPTVYGINHPALFGSADNWSFINVLGNGGVNFSRIAGLDLPDGVDTSNLLDKTAGGTVAGYVTLTDTNVSHSLELHGVVYDLTAGWLMGNKAGGGYIPTLTRDITGDEAVLNINNVGLINPNGNPTRFGGIIATSSIGINGGLGTSDVGKIIPNAIDGNNGGITLQYKDLGAFKDGLVLDRFGNATIANSVIGITEPLSENSNKLSSTKWVKDYSASISGSFTQIDSPAAPSVAINNTTGNLTGTYIYQVTFYTATGETEGGANTAPLTVTAQRIDLVNIPTSSDPKIIGRKIYRSGDYADTVVKQLVTTLADNTTTSYTDNIANSSLGVYIPRVNTTGGQLIVNNNRIGAADSSSTLFGRNTMPLNQGYANSAFGLNVLTNNTYGFRNTAMGVNAMYNNTTGYENSGFGVHALDNTTTGFSNTAVGYAAMIANTTGSDNTAVGKNAASVSTAASRITAVGSLALHLNSTGQNLCAFGNDALQANTSGQNNSAFGESALGHNQTGNFNTAVGSDALYSATGNGNTSVGFQSFMNSTGGGNVGLGTFAGYYETGSNKLFIDNTNRADEADARVKALIYGIFDNAVANQLVRVNSTLQVGNVLDFADNAAAIAGGLAIGTVYKTGDNLKIVH